MACGGSASSPVGLVFGASDVTFRILLYENAEFFGGGSVWGWCVMYSAAWAVVMGRRWCLGFENERIYTRVIGRTLFPTPGGIRPLLKASAMWLSFVLMYTRRKVKWNVSAVEYKARMNRFTRGQRQRP